MRLWKDLSTDRYNYYDEERLRKCLFEMISKDIYENIDNFYSGDYGLEYNLDIMKNIKTLDIEKVYDELLSFGCEFEEIDFKKGDYEEYIFYLGLQVCNDNSLIIDNYYSTIKNTILIDFLSKGYNSINEGLLECVNRYINDNKRFIEETLNNEMCFDY